MGLFILVSFTAIFIFVGIILIFFLYFSPLRSVGFVERLILVAVIAIGVCAGMITTYTAAAAIATPGALGQTCFFS